MAALRPLVLLAAGLLLALPAASNVVEDLACSAKTAAAQAQLNNHDFMKSMIHCMLR
jgi:hypothetical protein